jgi:hypothetical protein
MSAPSRKFSFLSLATWLALTAGCLNPGVTDSARRGPYFTPANHVGDPSLGGIRRVVLLPAAGGGVAPPESMGDLDAVFVAELQRERRFEVVPLSREQCARLFLVPEFSSVSALPAGFMDVLHREFAADAVIFVDVTVFHAYQPVALGLRGKLATLRDSRLVWTFDEVFSADNAAVANSARRHFLRGDSGGVPADLSPAVLQSPARFTGYAAAAMFDTLPPVTAPVVIPDKSAATASVSH